MFDNLKNNIKTNMQDTVFGEARVGMKYLLEKNKKMLAVEFVLCYLLTVLATGAVIINILNLGGAGYKMSLVNIVAAWLKYYGVVISIPVFIFFQLIVFKFIKLFRTSYHRDEERNFDISEEGTYGNSRFMTEEDMKKTFILAPISDMKAPIFGKDPYNTKLVVGQKHPMMKLNRNTFMVAGPSAGKSATFVIPLIMQIMRAGQSAIISDPKSELFKILSELGKMLGYEVRILNLNPMFLDNSDPCNFLLYVGDDVDKAQVVANAIINTTTDGNDLLDFWTEGALNLLQAIILRINVGNDYTKDEKNLPMLFTYLTQHTLEDMEADFDNLRTDHPATAPFLIFKDGKDDVKKQVLQGLRIKLKLFNSVKLRKILSKSEGSIDILNPGRKRCLYFIGSNDQDSSMSSVVSLFYTLVYQELVKYADRRVDGQLPIAVHMVLDEYANMAAIPDFEKKLSTVRSRNIVTYIICQDINQLKTKHPGETWKTVLNDCDYYMMLKTNDLDTMKWWEDMCGTLTANVKNKRYSRSKYDITGIHVQEDVTEGQGARKVLMMDDARKLKDDEVLVLVSQRDVAKLKTFFWKKDHPYGQYITKHEDTMYVLPAQHYPFWKLIEDGIVNKDFDYDHEPSFVMELKPDENLVIDEDYDPDEILKIKEKKKQVGTNVIKKAQKEVASRNKQMADEAKKKIDAVKPNLFKKKKEEVKEEKKDDGPEHRINIVKTKGQEENQQKKAAATEPERRPEKPKPAPQKKKPEKALLPDPMEKKKKEAAKKKEEQAKMAKEQKPEDIGSEFENIFGEEEETEIPEPDMPEEIPSKEPDGEDDFFKGFGSFDEF